MNFLRTLTIIILISYCGYAQSQDSNGSSKKIRFTAFASGGRSIFFTNPSAPSKFPTLELRLGAGIIKPLGKNVELRSRLSFGAKFKREAINRPGQPYIIGPPFTPLDELASNRNYYFIEIPLAIQFNLPHPKIGLSFGLNYRFFLPHNKSVDFLANRRELGILPGITYRLSDKVHIGFDYCFGLTKIFSAAGQVDNKDVTINMRNQFAQIRFDYALPGRK